MPAPGSVWATNTWDANAWAANVWADAVDLPDPPLGAAARSQPGPATRVIFLASRQPR